jgi:hypothetical protein
MAEGKIRIEDDFAGLSFNSGPLEDRLRSSVAIWAANSGKSIFGTNRSRNEAALTYWTLNNDRFDFGEIKKAHKAATIQRLVDSKATVILASKEYWG